MQRLFAIFGYGVPRNIMKDENYSRYLSFCFNKIYDLADSDSIIVFSGGLTDCHPPYQRTEAEEMKRLFENLRKRKFVKEKTRNWKLKAERRSISSLENVLYLSDYLQKNKINHAEVYVFCETTRGKRIKAFFRVVHGENKHLKQTKFMVMSVDFDLSLNRYLDRKFLEEKERKTLLAELKAMRSKKNFVEYKRRHQKKLEFFRKNNYVNDPRLVEEWWRKNLQL